jgi:hypothetical protein
VVEETTTFGWSAPDSDALMPTWEFTDEEGWAYVLADFGDDTDDSDGTTTVNTFGDNSLVSTSTQTVEGSYTAVFYGTTNWGYTHSERALNGFIFTESVHHDGGHACYQVYNVVGNRPGSGEVDLCDDCDSTVSAQLAMVVDTCEESVGTLFGDTSSLADPLDITLGTIATPATVMLDLGAGSGWTSLTDFWGDDYDYGISISDEISVSDESSITSNFTIDWGEDGTVSHDDVYLHLYW